MNFTGRLRFRRDSRVLSPRSVFLRAFRGLAGLVRRAEGGEKHGEERGPWQRREREGANGGRRTAGSFRTFSLFRRRRKTVSGEEEKLEEKGDGAKGPDDDPNKDRRRRFTASLDVLERGPA